MFGIARCYRTREVYNESKNKIKDGNSAVECQNKIIL